MNRANKKNTLDKDRIDLVYYSVKLWKKKIIIIRTTLIFLFIGVAYSLSLPNIYESSSTFYPHYEENNNNNSLRNLAGIAGINLDRDNYTNIPTSLYPNLIESIPYKEDILNENIDIDSESITFKNYLKNQNQNLSIFSLIIEYTLGLPSKIFSFIKSILSDDSLSIDNNINNKKSYLSFDDEDYDLFKSLDNIIRLQSNTKDGYLILSAKHKSPEVAAQIAQIAQEKLQQRIINYKLKNTILVYDYTFEQFEKRKIEFYNLQDSLAKFKDRNKTIKSEKFLNQLERLQYEVDLINSIYKELGLQKEKVNLEIKKNTPIFTIINPVILPKNKVQPQRLLIVIVYSLLGMLISTIFILTKDSFLKIKKEFS